MPLDPHVKYWLGWVCMGVAFLAGLYFVIKHAVIAAWLWIEIYRRGGWQ